MKICKNEITDYSSANFTEDEPEWLVGNLYNVGDEARDDHYIYKYAGVDNTNTATKPSLNPIQWKQNRTSNYYAMLGDKTNEQTIVNGDLEIEIEIENYDTIGLLNITGSGVAIEMTDNATSTIVFTDTFDLQNNQDIIDAYTHYFSPFDFFNTYYANLPLFNDATLKITISSLSGQSAIGRLVSGQSYAVGSTLFGANQTLQSYSGTTTDQFGSSSLQQTGSVFNASYGLSVPSEKVGNLKRKRKELNGVPVLFIADEEEDSTFENLLSYGLWEKADILLESPSFSSMDMTIKELL